MRPAPILPVTDRRLAAIFSIGVSCAVLAPLLQHRRGAPVDSFPLSYYPMFTAKRGRRARITHLVGVDAQGGHRPLPYTLAGCGGLNQVRKHLTRAVEAGRAEQLCRAVAATLVRRQDPGLAGVVTVQVVTGSYRLGRYFAGETAPIAERVHAAQPVLRSVAEAREDEARDDAARSEAA